MKASQPLLGWSYRAAKPLIALTPGIGLAGGYRVREDHHKDPRIKEIAAFAVQQVRCPRAQVRVDLLSGWQLREMMQTVNCS